MDTIPRNKNKIEAIKDYLVANRLDTEGDSWIFGHIQLLKIT